MSIANTFYFNFPIQLKPLSEDENPFVSLESMLPVNVDNLWQYEEPLSSPTQSDPAVKVWSKVKCNTEERKAANYRIAVASRNKKKAYEANLVMQTCALRVDILRLVTNIQRLRNENNKLIEQLRALLTQN